MSWVPPGPAMLFCPADRPERYQKAADRADVVILDLEDAVRGEAKVDARAALIENPLDPNRTIVRVNPANTGDFRQDLQTLADTDYRVVMLAKAEAAQQVHDTGLQVIGLIETPLGALAAAEIAAAPECIGLMWGAEDLTAALGGRSSRFGPDEPNAGRYRQVAQHVRSTVRLAAAAYGKFAVDSVYLDIPDTAGLRMEALDAAALGYEATACIHPSQVEVIRSAYRPTDDEIEWANKILGTAPDAHGVFRVDGQMVDAPVLRQAEAISRRAAAGGANARGAGITEGGDDA